MLALCCAGGSTQCYYLYMRVVRRGLAIKGKVVADSRLNAAICGSRTRQFTFVVQKHGSNPPAFSRKYFKSSSVLVAAPNVVRMIDIESTKSEIRLGTTVAIACAIQALSQAVSSVRDARPTLLSRPPHGHVLPYGLRLAGFGCVSSINDIEGLLQPCTTWLLGGI